MNRIIAIIITLFSIANIHAQSYYIQCEDTCQHIHGIDISHYQGNVFWEAIGNNSKMYYVYLKATEGGDLIDAKYEQNIQLAHQYGLKVGSYHFYRARTPQEVQLRNFMAQCRPGEQDLVPMIDVETKSGLSNEAFRDSLSKFLILVEKKYKQKPLIYTGANFYDHYLSGGMLDDYKIMIAQYMA
ncbi:MAG: glycosyl hydrolase family 25, partial [Prevotella sp.]|nr:glycosyl hydrolase family 25 [Prevotella sp.]